MFLRNLHSMPLPQLSTWSSNSLDLWSWIFVWITESHIIVVTCFSSVSPTEHMHLFHEINESNICEYCCMIRPTNGEKSFLKQCIAEFVARENLLSGTMPLANHRRHSTMKLDPNSLMNSGNLCYSKTSLNHAEDVMGPSIEDLPLWLRFPFSL